MSLHNCFAKKSKKRTIFSPGPSAEWFAEFFQKNPNLGARLRGRMATQRSKKGSENVLGRVLGKGFSEGF